MGGITIKILPKAVLSEAESFTIPYAAKAVADAQAAYADALRAEPSMASDSEGQKAFDQGVLFATQLFTRMAGEVLIMERRLSARLDTMADDILSLQVRQ